MRPATRRILVTIPYLRTRPQRRYPDLPEAPPNGSRLSCAAIVTLPATLPPLLPPEKGSKNETRKPRQPRTWATADCDDEVLRLDRHPGVPPCRLCHSRPPNGSRSSCGAKL